MSVFHFLLSVANIFIKFADANMKSALLAQSEFAGMNNITYSQAKSVVATWGFDENTSIESFDELQHFKSLIVCPTFYGCTNLQSIIIPDNIITIPANCFYGCVDALFKNISKNVTSVGSNAFNGCTELKEVEFKDTNFTTLNSGVFQGCTSLTKVDTPNVTYIESSVFDGCTSLSTITFDWSKITSIGAEAFKNCNALSISSITFGANSVLTNIYNDNLLDGPFKGSSIKNITINNNLMTSLNGFKGTTMTSVVAPNVTSIAASAFQQASVTNIMSFPNVTIIDYNAFYQTNFGNGKIDLYNIVKFNDNAFWGSVSLRSLGDNFNWSTVKYIGAAVFKSTRITMPRELNCKIIGHQAFNLDADAIYPNVNNKKEKYIILRFNGSDISDINDYPTGTNGQDLIRKGVVGFIPYLSFKQSPFGGVQVVYVPDSEPDENNKTIKDYYLESIWGQLVIGTSSNLLSFRTYSEAQADEVTIT